MSNRTIHFLIALYLFAFISFCFAEDLGYRDDEILVRFTPKPDKSQRSISEKNQVLSALNVGTVLRSEDFLPGLTLVKLRNNITVSQAIDTLKNDSSILHVQPNFIYRALATFPNEVNSPGRFNEQWALHNTGQTGGTINADINAPEAWDIITDSNIIVAVIDSGVDYTHPDLAANMWTDANGRHGYDFVNNDNYPMDDYGHGTHVAGIIGAVGNNGIGVTGVCWNVKII
jgi:subtilisin family serine protease